MRRSMLPLLFFVIGLILPLSTYASATMVYTVKPENINKQLFLSGTISPIRSVPVLSPTQGVVDALYFTYGETVKKGQVLLHIHTTGIAPNLRTAKINFLKANSQLKTKEHWKSSGQIAHAEYAAAHAKQTLSAAKLTYEQNQKLYSLGIVSKLQLVQSQNAYQASQEQFNQARISLMHTLAQGEGQNLLIAHLLFDNAQDKYQSLLAQSHTHTIKAPANGIVLMPQPNQNTHHKNAVHTLAIGSTITYREGLMTIGDMSGIKLNIQVPENHINAVKKGEHATITGPGFKGISLTGIVTAVGAQALNAQGGEPSFPVIITVKHLTAQQQHKIRVGMNAKVALTLATAHHVITVPITAISQNAQGNSQVMVYKNGTTTPTQVQTGLITAHRAEITSGLTAGQKIAVPKP